MSDLFLITLYRKSTHSYLSFKLRGLIPDIKNQIRKDFSGWDILDISSSVPSF